MFRYTHSFASLTHNPTNTKPSYTNIHTHYLLYTHILTLNKYPVDYVQVCTFHGLVLVVPQSFGKYATYAQLKEHLKVMAYAKDEAAYNNHYRIIQDDYEYAG